MMNCKWIEALLAIIIIIFTYWSTSYSMWIIILAALGILIHALVCKMCHVHSHKGSDMKMPAKRRK